MRRLAARRTGGTPDNKPGTGRRPPTSGSHRGRLGRRPIQPPCRSSWTGLWRPGHPGWWGSSGPGSGSLEGYQTTAFSTPDADRQLIMATNLQPEPEPGAAAAAVESILRREVSC
jgi:hypothetical protein